MDWSDEGSVGQRVGQAVCESDSRGSWVDQWVVY